jgi:hypothetical protein
MFYETETRVLGCRPKLLEFHTSGLATYTNTPNKKMNDGEGQRKEISVLQPIFGIQT